MAIATSQVTITDLNDGVDGQDGQTSYVHIAYATNATGTAGFSTTDPAGKTYMGTYTDFVAADSTDPTKYTWSLIKGDKGDTGSQGIQGPTGPAGQTLYTWLKYADTPTTGMSDSPTGKAYIGLAYNKTTSTESSNYADYTWSLIKGDTGSQGVPGPTGPQGQATYTWIKYGTSAAGSGMSDDPAGKTYIGIAYNKTTATESTNAADYTWSLIQGPTGPQGDAGPAGPTLYTWVKYADNASGSGLSDSPTGKTYIGLAYNKTTAAESTTPGDYTWSLIKGDQGVQGPAGPNGQTTYTWIKYADTDTGTGLSDSPTGKRYLGLAHNKTTATESTNAADYVWSPLFDTVATDKINNVVDANGLLIGSKLAPNTVTAQSIAIGDFTNVSQINEVTNPNGNAVITANSKVYFRTGTAASSKLILATALAKEFRLDDYYYVALNGYKDATVTTVTFIVRYRYTDDTTSNAGSVVIPYTTADTKLVAKCKITLDPTAGKTLKSVDFFLEKDAGTSGYFYTRDIDVRKMNTGQMIVDGSITASQLNVSNLSAVTANLGDVTAGSITNTWTYGTDATATVAIARSGDAMMSPSIKLSYSSPGGNGTTEMYGWGMKIKALGYDLVFNNFNSTMSIDAVNNDLRLGTSRAFRFFPDWNGVNGDDFRHFYMKVEKPSVAYYAATSTTQEKIMVLGVATDMDQAGTSTGGTMALRSGNGYILVQPEANNAGNNTFSFTVQEDADAGKTHGLFSYGSIATPGGTKSGIRFRKDTSGLEVINTSLGESSSTLGFIKASNFFSEGNTVLQADGGYVVIRTTKTDSPVLLQSDLESRSVAVNTSQTYKPFRASSFPVGSSINYKQNLEKIEDTDIDPLGLVVRSQVWKYHLNSNIDSGVYDKPKIGLISEMVEPIVRDQDGVDPYSIASIAWAAIKQQQKIIESQQTQIDELKEMITLLMNQ